MTRVEGQPGWILHRRPWRESSLLIEYLSRDYGRVGLVARGARAERSAWRGVAEPFCPLRVSWTRRGEMGTVTALDTDRARHVLEGRSLWCGLYANELLIKLLVRDDPLPAVFDAYGHLLAQLAEKAPAGRSLRGFELRLLEAMGVAPDFSRDAASGLPIETDKLYHLDPETGFAAAARTGQSVFPGSVIQDLRSGRESSAGNARKARLLMRILIDHQLGGRRIQARRLFEVN